MRFFSGSNFPSDHFGQGSIPIVMDYVNCSGSEFRLWDCNHFTHSYGCTHSHDVGIRCQPGLCLFNSSWLRSPCSIFVANIMYLLCMQYCNLQTIVLQNTCQLAILVYIYTLLCLHILAGPHHRCLIRASSISKLHLGQGLVEQHLQKRCILLVPLSV